MSPRPHRVDPRQPARNQGGNRDEYLRGYKAGLGSPPPSSGSSSELTPCGVVFIALLVVVVAVALLVFVRVMAGGS